MEAKPLPPRNYAKLRHLLCNSAFRPVFLRLLMDTRPGQYIPPSPNPVPIQDETQDPTELPGGIGDTEYSQSHGNSMAGTVGPLVHFLQHQLRRDG